MLLNCVAQSRLTSSVVKKKKEKGKKKDKGQRKEKRRLLGQMVYFW